MKPSAIVAKTFPFILNRLLAYLIFFIGICIYTAIVIALLGLIKPDGFFAIILFVVFVGGGLGFYRFARNYINYMIRAAHVAVIADLTINGTVPEGFNMYQHGVGKVKKYFAAANLLFVLDRLVSAAVKQIQRALNKVANFLKFIPGVKNIMGIINLFVDIILNYVDECIMAYIFLHEGQSAWKSAADGVVLYVQNWKTVLKTGAKILVFLVLFFVVSFLAFNGLFVSVLSGIIGLDSLVSPFATILTIVFILVLKWAVVDSIVMIYMMNNYLKVAYGTEPSYDLYEKLKGMSKKFRELVGKTNQPSGEGIGATI